jgi:hypothetical protein
LTLSQGCRASLQKGDASEAGQDLGGRSGPSECQLARRELAGKTGDVARLTIAEPVAAAGEPISSDPKQQSPLCAPLP